MYIYTLGASLICNFGGIISKNFRTGRTLDGYWWHFCSRCKAQTLPAPNSHNKQKYMTIGWVGSQRTSEPCNWVYSFWLDLDFYHTSFTWKRFILKRYSSFQLRCELPTFLMRPVWEPPFRFKIFCDRWLTFSVRPFEMATGRLCLQGWGGMDDRCRMGPGW